MLDWSGLCMLTPHLCHTLSLSPVQGSACMSISLSLGNFNGDRTEDPDATANGWTARISWKWAHQRNPEKGRKSTNRAVLKKMMRNDSLVSKVSLKLMKIQRDEP